MLKTIFLFIGLCLCMIACKDDLGKQIGNLESSLSHHYSNEKAKQLLALYENAWSLSDQNGLDRSEIALKAAALCVDHLKDYNSAITYIKRIMEKGSNSAASSISPLLLQMHSNILHNSAEAAALDKDTKDYVAASLRSLLPEVEQTLKIAKANMVDSATLKLSSPDKVLHFANISESLATLVGDTDPIRSCNLLFEAANASRAAGNFQDAVRFYDLSSTRCADQERAATSLFLRAFTCENDLKDFEQARIYYDKFLERYPKHEMAQSAKISINNLGVPADQLLEKLQKN